MHSSSSRPWELAPKTTRVPGGGAVHSSRPDCPCERCLKRRAERVGPPVGFFCVRERLGLPIKTSTSILRLRNGCVSRADRRGPLRALMISRDEGQSRQMRGNTQAQTDNSPVADRCFPLREVDFHIVMIEKHPIERIYRLVDCFFSDEQHSSSKPVGIQVLTLSRCRDQIHQFGGQKLGRLDIYSQCLEIPRATDRRDGIIGIVSERTSDTLGPSRRSSAAALDGALRIAKLLQQASCNQTRRSTRPPNCCDAPVESRSLLRQESCLISWHNKALSDHYAGNGQLVDRCRKHAVSIPRPDHLCCLRVEHRWCAEIECLSGRAEIAWHVPGCVGSGRRRAHKKCSVVPDHRNCAIRGERLGFG
jgi:hypothetical protein